MTNTNQVVTATVTSVQRIGNTHVAVLRVEEDLAAAGIVPIRLAPPSFTLYANSREGMPVVGFMGGGFELGDFPTAAHLHPNMVATVRNMIAPYGDPLKVPLQSWYVDPQRQAFYWDIYENGDSSNVVAAIVVGQLVLLGCIKCGGGGSGDAVWPLLSQFISFGDDMAGDAATIADLRAYEKDPNWIFDIGPFDLPGYIVIRNPDDPTQIFDQTSRGWVNEGDLGLTLMNQPFGDLWPVGSAYYFQFPIELDRQRAYLYDYYAASAGSLTGEKYESGEMIADDPDQRTFLTARTTELPVAPDNAGIAAARLAAERIAGGGGIPCDHNTGGTDSLRLVDGDDPVSDAIISAYLQSEYDAGTKTLRGQSITGGDGRWVRPVYLAAGTYVITFQASGYQAAIVRGVVI